VAHYQRGRDLYHAGRYREAIDELQQALRLDPASPELTYNVARVYELLGEIDTAIQYYARSRDLLPAEAHEERARTSTTIQRLQGAKRHAQVVPSSRPTAAQDAGRHGVADAAFWSVGAVGVGALAGGAASGVLALQYSRRAQQFVLGLDGNAADRNLEAQRADRLAFASDALLAAGATLTITSLLLFAIREKPSAGRKDGTRLSAGFGHSRAVFILEGTL
jgi:tetratricopeptide (TPR) repeat protein